MTRLTPADLAGIPAELPAYDAELEARTGCSLRALACRAVGVGEPRLAELARGVRVAVVPLDCGQGVLPGFAEAVRVIASRLGFEAWVTTRPDAGGLAEAFREGAGMLVTADEDSFIAVNLATRAVADNNEATARGFVTALSLLAGGLAGQEALVLGCGPVGRAAARHLLAQGAQVSLCDIRSERAREAAGELGGEGGSLGVQEELEAALLHHHLLFDATPMPGFIRERHLKPETRIAAPGVPLGLTAGALRAIGPHLVHDPLQIGTAVMLLEALAG
jgi:pyrrolysine biosynthesis protein PylD